MEPRFYLKTSTNNYFKGFKTINSLRTDFVWCDFKKDAYLLTEGELILVLRSCSAGTVVTVEIKKEIIP